MTVANRFLGRSFLLFTAYTLALIGSFALAVRVWGLNGFLSSLDASQSMSSSQLVTTYSLTVIVVPWITVTIQAFVVWFQSRFEPGGASFGAIWRVVFWTFVVPQTIRGLITNAIFITAGHPVDVSFGMALLGSVPRWVDFVSDAFFIAQLTLFFYFFQTDGTVRKRVELLGGLVVGRILAAFLL